MIQSLAYFGFETPAADQWVKFGPEILGLGVVAADGDAVKLQSDDVHHRYTFTRGPIDRVAWLGWDVGDEASLNEIEQALGRVGITATQATEDEIADRCVIQMKHFIDPMGFRNELAYGFLRPLEPFRPDSIFLTGEQGVGHAFLLVPDQKVAVSFLMQTLGMHQSDIVRGHGLDASFFNCNPRHHTLGTMAVPGMRGIHHFMLQVNSLDDVGRAYDRCLDHGVPIVLSLGRHTNDQMMSFYLQTPSTFQIEIGWGAIEVSGDESMVLYDAPSRWGHRLLLDHVPMALEPVA